MTDFLEPETKTFEGKEFQVLYTGIPDGREIIRRLNKDYLIEAPENGKLYQSLGDTGT